MASTPTPTPTFNSPLAISAASTAERPSRWNSVKRWTSTFALAAVAVAGNPAAAAGGAKPVVPPVNKPAFPSISLPVAAAKGQQAIDLLGSRLPEVAAWYGKSPDELRSLLLNDLTHRIDRTGRMFVVDEIKAPLPPAANPPAGKVANRTGVQAAPTPQQTSESLLDGVLQPLDQTFFLHSKPGSKRTIYLNFVGATLSNTAWSASTITAQPFDLDGVPASFNTSELQRIQYIWQRVAEDFAAFDVNVTTEAPPADRLGRTTSTDDIFGTTVLITNSTGVYTCSCGGVAYVGVFDDTSEFYKPALVFYNQLGGSEKNIAEAISHEAGHNLGLSHDGTATAGYYTGQGSGVTGWAPIMGVGYNQSLVQWSKGEYSGANNTQDDYAVMQSNGLPLRVDDHGDTLGAATALAGVNTNGVVAATAQGVIERPTDVDVFAFSTTGGTASVTVSPAARSANLDALVRVLDSSGGVRQTINPADALNATATLSLSQGTYYVSVQGTGKGDPLTTGYTAYGSIGQYKIVLNYPSAGTNAAPTAVIAASTLRGTAPLTVTYSGAGSSDADGSLVAYDWSFSEGGSAAGASVARTYSTPGSYTTTLRVTDNGGLSSATAVTVTVDAPVVILPMRVADIAMSLRSNKAGNTSAVAAVKVVDGQGRGVPGASVSGAWSGLVTGTGTVVTDAFGLATFTSPSSKRTGSFTFTVRGVTLNGYAYQPATNTETSDSIMR